MALMNSLDKLNNVERAKLLFELFPGEMPAFISFMGTIAEKIMNDEKDLRENWERQLITVDFWLELAKTTKATLNKYGPKLAASSRLFADQLFDGYSAMLASHCLSQFKKVTTSQRFIKAIDVFFSFE